MSVIVLSLALAASAADLDLTLTVPDGEPVTVTIRDARMGPQPTLVVSGDDGRDFRLSSTMRPGPKEGIYEMDLLLEEVELDRKGREIARMLGQPTMVAMENQEAQFMAGAETWSDAENPELVFRGYVIEWVVHTEE